MIAVQVLKDCHSIQDLRFAAQRRLPAPIFHFLDGAAETEITARRNISAFDMWELVPRCLLDVRSVNTRTTVLGQEIAWPLLCSPTGGSRLFHADGELAVARAAARAGVFYSLATGGTYSIEDVANASIGPRMFQLYVFEDRAITWELIERCRHANYSALCLTVDTAAIGKRERDLRFGFNALPRVSRKNILHFALRPTWMMRFGLRGIPTLANLKDRLKSGTIIGPPDPSLSWKDVRDIADLWGGRPFALKGILSVEDACRAADAGVTAVIVSNHGGRQLDGAVPAIAMLPDIVKAVGDRVEVILDGGVRRGVHILKALALGAKACSIGRPYLYGLSAGGREGVARALEILCSEFVLAMKLTGCTDVGNVSKALLRHVQ